MRGKRCSSSASSSSSYYCFFADKSVPGVTVVACYSPRGQVGLSRRAKRALSGELWASLRQVKKLIALTQMHSVVLTERSIQQVVGGLRMQALR